MSPLDLVGIPDWRSALIAALFALPWLMALAWGWLRRPWLWVAVVAAALLFPLSIAWIQVPIQNGLSQLWQSLLSREVIRRYALIVYGPTILASGVVQEAVKLLIAMRRLGAQHDPRGGLAVGAASGAGYGGLEAFWALNAVLSVGWSWGTVQLAGPAALLPFIERFLAVPFHIGATSLAAYGHATGRTWRFWLLAAGLHSLTNYSVVLLQMGVLNAWSLEVWVGLVSLATVGVALWLRWRLASLSAPV